MNLDVYLWIDHYVNWFICTGSTVTVRLNKKNENTNIFLDNNISSWLTSRNLLIKYIFFNSIERFERERVKVICTPTWGRKVAHSQKYRKLMIFTVYREPRLYDEFYACKQVSEVWVRLQRAFWTRWFRTNYIRILIMPEKCMQFL